MQAELDPHFCPFLFPVSRAGRPLSMCDLHQESCRPGPWRRFKGSSHVLRPGLNAAAGEQSRSGPPTGASAPTRTSSVCPRGWQWTVQRPCARCVLNTNTLRLPSGSPPGISVEQTLCLLSACQLSTGEWTEQRGDFTVPSDTEEPAAFLKGRHPTNAASVRLPWRPPGLLLLGCSLLAPLPPVLSAG